MEQLPELTGRLLLLLYFADIDVLQKYGNELRLPLVCQMGGVLYELSTEEGNNISRLFYFFYHRNYIVRHDQP